MAFIRSSKFRHVFGTPSRKDACMEGFRVTNCAFEGNFIAANGKFVAFCVEVGGGGAFCVLPVTTVGRLDVSLPKVSGHRDYILDLQWNPYNDSMLATCSEDGSIKIWDFPDQGPLTNWDADKALLNLDYHERRCVQIAWHPIASSVLMSVSAEPKVCIWNLDSGELEVEVPCNDIVFNAAWSSKGDRFVTSSKDKKFRIFDARSAECLFVVNGHEGSKSQRVIFALKDTKLLSTGFSRMSERQYALWEIKESEKSVEQLSINELDTANSCLIPMYDEDCGLLYLSAKGDSVIRYYELVEDDPWIYYISTFQSKDPQRGVASIPKRSVNVNACEVMRFYKLHGTKTGMIEPISMTVPRKSDLYQSDLYPATIGPEAAVEAIEWFEGENAEPLRIDMSEKFVSKTKSVGPSGGGLKKGGLKGLKAKKEAKAPVVKAVDPVKSEPAPEPKKESPAAIKRASPPASRPQAAAAASSSSTSSIDSKSIDNIQEELKLLRISDKQHKSHIQSLEDKLKDYEKLTGDIKLLCDAVKKNDERIAALEALVQEESDDEGQGE